MLSSPTLRRLRFEPLEKRQLMYGPGVADALESSSPLLVEELSFVTWISSSVERAAGDAAGPQQCQTRPHDENSTATKGQDDATRASDSVFESWNEAEVAEDAGHWTTPRLVGLAFCLAAPAVPVLFNDLDRISSFSLKTILRIYLQRIALLRAKKETKGQNCAKQYES